MNSSLIAFLFLLFSTITFTLGGLIGQGTIIQRAESYGCVTNLPNYESNRFEKYWVVDGTNFIKF